MKTLRMLFLVLVAPLAAYAQSPDTIYAITDVRVSHGTGAVIDEMKRSGYKPLVENACVSPPLPGLVSYGDMADLNRGIEGDTVGVWVRYEQIPVSSDRKVLVDLAVTQWPDWNVQCPAGFQPASGDARITVKTRKACNRNGLCVKYAPLKDTGNATIVTALSLTRATSDKYLCGGGQCMGNTGVTNLNLAGIDVHTNCGEEAEGRVWVYICRNSESRSSATKAIQAVTPEEKLRLLKTYAPRIYLAKDEKYFPSDVEWSFANMVRYQDKDGNYWIQTKEPLVVLSTNLDYWAGFSDVSRAPVYAFWVDKSGSADGSSYVDLVYFTYYPYNLGKQYTGVTWGNHVGDWEHLTVRLKWVESNGSWSLAPAGVYIPFHDSGKAYRWDEAFKTATHPIAFAASGSHGLWPNAGSHPYKTYVGNAVVLTDETSQGKAWDTWNRLIAWDYRARMPLTGEPWPAWMSTKYSYAGQGDPTRPQAGPIYRWGNSEQMCIPGVCRLENGPTGPPDKDVWRSDVFQ